MPKNSHALMAFDMETTLRLARTFIVPIMIEFKRERAAKVITNKKVSSDKETLITKADITLYIMTKVSKETINKLWDLYGVKIIINDEGHEMVRQIKALDDKKDVYPKEFILSRALSWAKYLNNPDERGCLPKVLNPLLLAFGITAHNYDTIINYIDNDDIDDKEFQIFIGHFYSCYDNRLTFSYIKMFPNQNKAEFHRMVEENGKISKFQSYQSIVMNERNIVFADINQKQSYLSLLLTYDPIKEKTLIKMSSIYIFDYRPIGVEGAKFESCNTAFLTRVQITDEEKDIEYLFRNSTPTQKQLAKLSGRIYMNTPIIVTDRDVDTPLNINGTFSLYLLDSYNESNLISVFKLHITDKLEIELYDTEGRSRSGYYEMHPTNLNTITLYFQPRPDINNDDELILIIFKKDSATGEMIKTIDGSPHSGTIYIQKIDSDIIPSKISMSEFGEIFKKKLNKDTNEEILNDIRRQQNLLHKLEQSLNN